MAPVLGSDCSDSPIGTDRKAAVDQGTDSKVILLPGEECKNLAQVLSTILLHSCAPLSCGYT